MRYVISIGANLGEAAAVVAGTLELLADAVDGESIAASSLYRTAPVGVVDQPDYVNAVAVVESQWSPSQVLGALQALEHRAGRVRDVRWGPRTLDLDIVVAGNVLSDDPQLTLPHPRAHERAFVLVPWLEVDPQAELPGHGPVRDIVAAGISDQQVQRMAP